MEKCVQELAVKEMEISLIPLIAVNYYKKTYKVLFVCRVWEINGKRFKQTESKAASKYHAD